MVVILRRERGGLGAAVEHADDNGVAGVAVQEAHHHLVVDLRAEEEAPVFARIQAGNPGPDAVGLGIQDGQAHLDPVLAIRVGL